MKVFVVFGSESDKSTYEPLCESLKKNGHEADFEVISAHRDPERLDEALKEKEYQVVIAGAGLSAHLPGVVASKIESPVIGISVQAQFGGFDALMSIVQMPYGVPVLACPPQDSLAGIDFINKIQKIDSKSFEKINFVVDETDINYEYVNLELKRTYEFLKSENIEYSLSHEPTASGLNIVLVTKDKMVFDSKDYESVIVNVPVFDQNKKKSVAQAMGLFDLVNQGGLWVGVSNTRNAVKSLLKFRGAIHG